MKTSTLGPLRVGLLGIGTVGIHRNESDDAVADVQAGDTLAHLVDRARDVVTRGVRERDRDREESAAQTAIRGVERRARDPDSHCTRTCRRSLDVFVAQNLGTTRFVKPYSLHDVLLVGGASNLKHLTTTVYLLRIQSKCFELEAR